jgi:signal transduction histidine kinase
MKSHYKNIKLYITITTLIVIIFNFLYYRSYYNQQIINHSNDLARQSKICGNLIEEKISDLRNDLKFYFTKEDFEILFNKQSTQNEAIKKLRQFFIKYNDLLTEITINDNFGNYLQFTGNTENYFSKKILKNNQINLIENDSVEKVDSSIIHFITTLKREKNTIANIYLKIDLKLFTENILKQYHVDEYNFQSLLDFKGRIIYSNYKYQNIEFSDINTIKYNIENNLESIIHQSIILKSNKQKIISSIYPIKIFGIKYGVLFSEKKSALYDVVYKKIGLISFFTIFFFLMIIFIFQILINTLKKNEAALIQRNKELEKITFSISHHLQEPLRKIAIFSDILQKKSKSETEGNNEAFVKIPQLVDYMRTLLNSMLKYTEVVRKKNIVKQKVDLNEIISEIKEKYKSNENIEFKINSLINIEGEKQLIKQLLENIIDNSVKFAKENSKCQIEILSKKEGKTIQLIIKDNGTGFEKKYETLVLEPFEKTGNKNTTGTGLGLTIAQKIAELHKGNIKIESEVDKGTKVIVEFYK